uniref:hypothetical protein n=1 Tax=Alistipes putredinis TaxID=28117 RepID=UPI004029D1FD
IIVLFAPTTILYNPNRTLQREGAATDDLPCKTETSLPINPIKQKTITLSVPVKQAQMPPDFPRHTNECQGTFPKSISSKDPYTQKRGEEIALFPSGIPLLVEIRRITVLFRII